MFFFVPIITRKLVIFKCLYIQEKKYKSVDFDIYTSEVYFETNTF